MKLFYFAWVRDKMGKDGEQIQLGHSFLLDFNMQLVKDRLQFIFTVTKSH